MKDVAEMMDSFTPVKANTVQMGRITGMENAFKEFGKEIIGYVPPCESRERILRILLAMKHMAIQEITHNRSLRSAEAKPQTQANEPVKKAKDESAKFST